MRCNYGGNKHADNLINRWNGVKIQRLFSWTTDRYTCSGANRWGDENKYGLHPGANRAEVFHAPSDHATLGAAARMLFSTGDATFVCSAANADETGSGSCHRVDPRCMTDAEARPALGMIRRKDDSC
jgi:hypothetical protein